MAFRRTLIASWLFCAAILNGQTVEELRARLAQADIDRAVMMERAHSSSPVSTVLIALIGALPALVAAWLTFEGNKMVRRSTEINQNFAARSAKAASEAAQEVTIHRCEEELAFQDAADHRTILDRHLTEISKAIEKKP